MIYVIQVAIFIKIYLKNTKRFGYIIYYEYFCKLKCV